MKNLQTKKNPLYKPETHEEIWDKKMYSVCYKCPFHLLFVKYNKWDPSYVPDSENFKSQEAVLDICTKYKMNKRVDIIKHEKRRTNIKKAKRRW